MKSAHVGGSQVDIEFVRTLIMKGNKAGTYNEFYKYLCGDDDDITPYHDLDMRHVQLLWRVLDRYEEKSLNSALDKIHEHTDMESIAHGLASGTIATFLGGTMRDVPLTSPSAQVMFNSFKEGE